METDLLDSVGEVRPGEGKVLQNTSQTPVGSRISHRITQISRQLRLSVDRSGAGLAISHPSPLQNIEGVLPLVKEKTRRARLNSDAQEVVELTQILHSKLLLQRGDDTLKQLLTGGCEHNVKRIMDVYPQTLEGWVYIVPLDGPLYMGSHIHQHP